MWLHTGSQENQIIEQLRIIIVRVHPEGSSQKKVTIRAIVIKVIADVLTLHNLDMEICQIPVFLST